LKKRKRNKTTSVFWRVAISFIGAALIAIGAINPLLYIFGKSASAVVTTRRVGGSDDGRPADQRYFWTINYTFTDDSGIEKEGNTSRRGGDISVTTSKTVRYFSFASTVNALEDETIPGVGQIITIGIGVFLIFAMNVKQKKPRAKSNYASNKNYISISDDYDDSTEEYFH
jgi:hypothetical protein